MKGRFPSWIGLPLTAEARERVSRSCLLIPKIGNETVIDSVHSHGYFNYEEIGHRWRKLAVNEFIIYNGG